MASNSFAIHKYILFAQKHSKDLK